MELPGNGQDNMSNNLPLILILLVYEPCFEQPHRAIINQTSTIINDTNNFIVTNLLREKLKSPKTNICQDKRFKPFLAQTPIGRISS